MADDLSSLAAAAMRSSFPAFQYVVILGYIIFTGSYALIRDRAPPLFDSGFMLLLGYSIANPLIALKQSGYWFYTPPSMLLFAVFFLYTIWLYERHGMAGNPGSIAFVLPLMAYPFFFLVSLAVHLWRTFL